ncbi:MAG: DUF3783 domain-containing protein [Oscillospiraceae bacterium]|nr:DUF3783 domain-containing protein [Oscillospiraceae bacterium]
MELVLLYTTNKDKAAAIEKLCGRLGFQFRRLTPMDIGCAVAAVVSGDYKFPLGRKAPLPAAYSQPELLVFSGLKDKSLDRFLQQYKKEELQPIALKAVVTPFNCNWTIYDLTQQLQREHDALHR